MAIDLLPQTDLQGIKEQLSDPAHFIESLIRFQGEPVRLYDFQSEIARNIDIMHDRCCIQKARQIGGSLLVAWMIVHAAYTNNDATFIIVSRTREQATFIAQYVRESFENSPLLAELINKKKTTKHDLRLKNGSVILDRTVGDDASNLRGISCRNKGALIYDESAYCPSSATETLLHVCHNAGLIHVSTPRRPYGAFYDACKNSDYRVYKIPATQSPRITAEALEKLRQELRPSQYRTDVLAEFAAGENAVFSAESIDKSIDDEIPLFIADEFNFDNGFPWTPTTHGYYYSLDVARSSSLDPWVLTIGDYARDNNSLQVVAYCSWAGSRSKHHNVVTTDDPRRITSDINEFRKRFPCLKFYVDATANEYYADDLHNTYLYPVEKVIWSQTRKQLLLEHLSTCLDAEKIAIPNDPTLVQQLIDFTYDTKRQPDDSMKRIYLAGNDDHVDSLAMLAQVVTTEPKYSNIDFVESW